MKELLWGIQSNEELPKWDEVWEEVTSNQYEIIFQTKQTFKHEDECEFGNFNFEYKYVVKIVYYDEEEGNQFGMTLFICPLAKHIDPRKIEKWKSYFSEFDIDTVDIAFIIDEEQCPVLKFETCVLDDDMIVDIDDWYSAELKEFLSKAGACVEIIDKFKGFALDKPENGFGTTGWDFLKGLIFGIDPLKLSLERL